MTLDDIATEVENKYKSSSIKTLEDIDKSLPKTTMEMESGWTDKSERSKIPEGAPVRTHLVGTGYPTSGRAYPSLGQISSPQIPLSKEGGTFYPEFNQMTTKQISLTGPPRNRLLDFVGGVGKGTQTALGLPADLLGAVVGSEKPVLGGKWMNDLTGNWKSQGAAGKYGEALGEQIPLTLAGPMGRSAKTGQSILQGLRPMVAPAIGSAVGTGTARALDMSPGAEMAMGMVGGAIPAAKTIGGALLGETAERIGQYSPSIAKALTPSDDLDKIIKYDYAKAIRPSTGGKQGFNDWKQSQDKAVDAIKTIVNQSREKGISVPRTVEDFSEAIENSRKSLFTQYNAMAKETGEQGATINLTPIISDLQKFRTSKALQDFGGNAIDAVDDLINKIGNRQSYTPEEAEDAIALLNKKLQGYYAGRSSGLNEVTAGVYDTVARVMRSALDDTIEKHTGPGYQSLKNKYGALRSIEKDVINRAVADARKPNAGLLDFSDMFSASKAVYSAAKLDPAGAAAAGTMFAVKRGLKRLNDPNHIVEKMFKNVDKRLPKKEQWGPLPKEEEKFIMTPYEGQVTSERGLVPTGKTTQQTVDGSYREVTPLGMTPRAGLLDSPRNLNTIEAGWKPQNFPGRPSSRITTLGTTQQEASPFDFNTTLSAMVDKGYSPIEAREILLRHIKTELIRRKK